MEISQLSYVLMYLASAILFATIDTLWLGTMAPRIYRPLLGDILIDNFRIAPAIAFYAFYAVGLTIFAVEPAHRSGVWTTALIWGALFGLFAYGTYDLTNYATLRNWGLKITLIDMAWGTFVSALGAVLAFHFSGWLMRLLGTSGN